MGLMKTRTEISELENGKKRKKILRAEAVNKIYKLPAKLIKKINGRKHRHAI